MKYFLLYNQVALQGNLILLTYFQYEGMTGSESLFAFFNILVCAFIAGTPIVLANSGLPIDGKKAAYFTLSSFVQLLYVFLACGTRISYVLNIGILAAWSLCNVFALYRILKLCNKENLKLVTVVEALFKK